MKDNWIIRDDMKNDLIKAVLKLKAKGFSQRKISRELDIHRNKVMSILRDYNHTILSDEKVAELVSNYLSGEFTQNELSKKFEISTITITRIMNSKGYNDRGITRSNKKYIITNENFFETIDTPQKAYWLGFVVADGYISISDNRFGIELAKKDKDHLIKFKNALESNKGLEERKRKGRLTAYQFRLSSKKIINDLSELGITGNKTYNMKSMLKKLDKDLQSHYLRGVFDGDGCIYLPKKKNDCVISLTGKYEVLLDFAKFFNLDISRIKTKTTNHVIALSGNRQCFKILSILYQDTDESIRLDRKYEIFNDHFKNREK